MRDAVRIEYHARPNPWRYMSGALLPSPGLRAGVPAMSAHWRGHRVNARELADFTVLSGLRAAGTLPLLYPHVMSFALHMALLMHPRFPLPIWRVLQVRNRLLQYRPLHPDAVLDIEVATAGHRVLDKGVEIDLRATVRARDELAWEAMNTFYVRGRFGTAHAAPPPSAPTVGDMPVAHWPMPRGGARRYAALTGDYNGLHLWDWYARRLGFRAAFHHPQRVLGHCLAHLDAAVADGPLQVDAWLKGPVHYGAPVTLHATARQAGEFRFALHEGAQTRPAFVGRVSRPAPGVRLDTIAPACSTSTEETT